MPSIAPMALLCLRQRRRCWRFTAWSRWMKPLWLAVLLVAAVAQHYMLSFGTVMDPSMMANAIADRPPRGARPAELAPARPRAAGRRPAGALAAVARAGAADALPARTALRVAVLLAGRWRSPLAATRWR